MSVVGTLHQRAVFGRRVARLTTALAAVLPQGAEVLDVGCGDGTITARLQALRPDCSFSGMDVLVRPHTAIPVRAFDGVAIPLADASVDAVLMVDVLHHTDDPVVLLREAARVARRAVVIKDHVVEGMLARPTLRAMDWVGNAHHGVRLPYNYWSAAQWRDGFARAGLQVERWETSLGLYPPPASWLFDRKLHMITVLRPASAPAAVGASVAGR